MSLFGVRVHTAEQPRFVVESDRVDVERVALPSADRMTVPGGKRVLGTGTVEIDPPHAGRVDEPEDHDDPAALLQPEKPAGHAGVSEDPVRQAYLTRVVRYSIGRLPIRAFAQGCKWGMIRLFSSSPGKSCLRPASASSRGVPSV